MQALQQHCISRLGDEFGTLTDSVRCCLRLLSSRFASGAIAQTLKPPTRTQPPRVPYLSIPFVTLSLSIPSMFLTSPHDNADPSLAELLAFSARAVACKRVVCRQGVGTLPAVRLPDGDVARERVEPESRIAPLPEWPGSPPKCDRHQGHRIGDRVGYCRQYRYPHPSKTSALGR